MFLTLQSYILKTVSNMGVEIEILKSWTLLNTYHIEYYQSFNAVLFLLAFIAEDLAYSVRSYSCDFIKKKKRCKLTISVLG